MTDYRNTNIKDVWSGKFYNDLRNQHLANEFENQFCKQCPDWQYKLA